jgi:transposase InsO family protein
VEKARGRGLVAVRMRMLECVEREGVTAASRRFRVSRPTLYKLMERYQAQGVEGLLNRAHGGQNRVPKEVEEAVVEEKVRLLSRSTAKIQQVLGEQWGYRVSRQTVWRILSSRGLARMQDREPIRRFSRPQPNQLWQVDLAEDEPTAAGKVQIWVFEDDASRYLLGAKAVRSKGQEHLLALLRDVLRRFGTPEAVLSDRGSQFRSTQPGSKAPTVYELVCELLGIRPIFAKRARTKGKVEKLIQFVQRDFLAEVRDRVRSLEQLNQELGEWVSHYNQRPHASLEYKPPASKYRPSSRPLPRELDQDWIFAVQQLRKVRRDATVSYRKVAYPVPPEHIGDHVWLHLVDSKVVITHAGKTIAQHPLRV